MKKKYKVGSFEKGYVTGIEKYGIFVSLDNKYNGLIHISEISELFVKNIHDYVKIGDSIKVRILEVDEKRCQLKLSIKNFDYQISKNRKNMIYETEHGFYTLSENLRKWIDIKKEELSSKTVKK